MPSLKCPDCRRVLKYAGNGKYECKNPDCPVIEVKVNGMKPPKILRVKRAATLINQPGTPFHSAICPVCGRTIERLGPVDVAVCDGGRKNPHPPVEISLRKGWYESDLKAKWKEIEA